MLSILFFISTSIFFISFLLIKKDTQKKDIIKSISINLVLLYCFNAIIAFVLSYIHIPTNLLTLSIIYLLLSLFIYFKYLKNNSRQVYFLDKKELIVVGIIFLMTFVIFLIRFGIPISIKYLTIDDSVHFESARTFYHESYLLNFKTNAGILNYETWRFAAYTNVGIFFKFCSLFISESHFYILYIIFEMITLFTSGVLFYLLINNGKNQIMKLIGTILFVLGYPLNSLLIGFFYIGHVINIFLLMLLIMQNERIPHKVKIVLLTIINLTITFLYYLFLPLVFLSECIYLFIQKKNIKSFLIEWIPLYIIPTICLILYFIIPTFSNKAMDLAGQMQLDGYFYNDVIGNVLLFIPIVVYYLCKQIKNKKVSFEIILFLTFIGLIIIFNIMMLLKIVMPYYVSKYYYIGWLIFFVLVFRCIDTYIIKNKLILNISLGFILFVFFWNVFGIEKTIYNLNPGEWNRSEPSILFNVYNYNFSAMNRNLIIFKENEIPDLIKLDTGEEFYTNMVPEQLMWYMIFMNHERLNCPVNKVYDCIEKDYILSLDAFLNQKNVDTYIYMNRNFYINDKDFIPETVIAENRIVSQLDKNKYKVTNYNFGSVIVRR